MKDIKRNGTQSERELTGRGGVAGVSLREINISWPFYCFFFSFLSASHTHSSLPLWNPSVCAAHPGSSPTKHHVGEILC